MLRTCYNRRRFGPESAGERSNEYLQATVKHGAPCNDGCSVNEVKVKDLVRINGVLSAEKYRQILSHHAIPSRKAYDWPQIFSSA